MIVREAGLLTVPWSGCVLHRIHLPRPVRTHRHHVFPIFLQVRKYGEVKDRRTVDVCPTGHDDVHAILDAMLNGGRIPAGAGTKERRMAAEALALFSS